MITKYGMDIKDYELINYFSTLKNKVYKLLPLKEEGLEWDKHLTTILIEISGLDELLQSQVSLIELSSKLEGLYKLEEFMLYRKTIFECLNIIDGLGR